MEKSNYYEKGLPDQVYASKKPGELIVIYEDGFPTGECGCVKDAILEEDSGAAFQTTKNNGKVELWKAENIQSDIHIDRVVGTLGSNTTHAEKVKFSFNYTNSFPVDEFQRINPLDLERKNSRPSSGDENKIIIAVLDTGVDFDLIPEEYLWSIEDKDQNGGKRIYGKNFVKDDNDENDFDVSEDNPSLHGTLINAYIIEQFSSSPHTVQIMNLKTHDKNGKGDLFSAIPAIQYAIKNGAHIINASWGFYIDEEMDNKILQQLKIIKKGVFFVTAAGNKIDLADLNFDELNNKDGSVKLDPRNISHHFFYPAYFSKGLPPEENNIIAVTTIDKVKDCVSPTQNFSPEIVDVGVQADAIHENPEMFLFDFPFKLKNGESTSMRISGSSFASAIASGKIGANFPVDFLQSDPKEEPDKSKKIKKELFDVLDKDIILKGNGKLKDQIREGRYMLKMGSNGEQHEQSVKM